MIKAKMDYTKLKKQLKQLRSVELDVDSRLKPIALKKKELDEELMKVRFAQRILSKIHEESFKAFNENLTALALPLSLKGTDAEIKEFREKIVDLISSVGLSSKVSEVDDYKKVHADAKFEDPDVNFVVSIALD